MTETTKVVIVNKYDEILCELESVGNFYRIPKNFIPNPSQELLDIGDTFEVKELTSDWGEE